MMIAPDEMLILASLLGTAVTFFFVGWHTKSLED